TVTLSQPREDLVATSVGHLALFAGGFAELSVSDRVDIYISLTDSWTTATLSQPRWGIAATSVGDLALFAGGGDDTGAILSDRVDIFLHCTSDCDCAGNCQNSLCVSNGSTEGSGNGSCTSSESGSSDSTSSDSTTSSETASESTSLNPISTI